MNYYYSSDTTINTSLNLNSQYLYRTLATSNDPLPPAHLTTTICSASSPATTYCQRKFYSSQALGGHQNAHKLERTLAKKSRELFSHGNVVGAKSGTDDQFDGDLVRRFHDNGADHSMMHQDELSPLDLYLRL